MRPQLQLNVYDRLVAVWNPRKALQQAQARTAISAATSVGEDFQGASGRKNSLRSWVTRLRGADRSAEGMGQMGVAKPRMKMMSRARYLVRNDAFARGAVTNNMVAIVGAGLRLQSRVDYETLKWDEAKALKWQKKTEAEFALFANSKDVDVSRKFDFADMQNLAGFAAFVDGDCFFMLPQIERKGRLYKTAIQLVLADRCENPPASPTKYGAGGIVGGVELGEYLDPVAYHFSNEAPDDMALAKKKFTRYPAFGEQSGKRQVFHLLCADWYDQTRGISYLAPVIDLFHTLDKYSDAELTAAVVSAYFTVFVSSKSGKGLPPINWDADDDGGGANTDENELKLGTGAVVEVPEDTTISTANPGRPNDKFDPFVQAILKKIAVGLNLPYEMLVMHFSSSYSASKAAILQAWRFYRSRRTWIAKNFCQPVYERFMDEAVSAGRIKAPGYFEDAALRMAYLGSAWIGEEPGSLDALKDANAAKIRLETGVTDLDEESLAATGSTYMEKHARITKIAELRTAAGLLSPGAVPPTPPPPPVREPPVPPAPPAKE
jgi:lambda family phage portal protein